MLTQLEAKNHATREATGATMFGPDSALWPAWWFDVVSVIGLERARRDNARNQAMFRRRGEDGRD